MRLRKTPRPLTPEENRKRNIERIMNPRKRTLWDRITGLSWAVEEFWCRHLTQRELYRHLDSLRLHIREHPATSDPLERLRADILGYPNEGTPTAAVAAAEPQPTRPGADTSRR